jgi:hypothetical protein
MQAGIKEINDEAKCPVQFLGKESETSKHWRQCHAFRKAA